MAEEVTEKYSDVFNSRNSGLYWDYTAQCSLAALLYVPRTLEC